MLCAMPRKAAAVNPAFARGISDTIQRALSSSGLHADSHSVPGVGRTIEKALSAAGLHRPHDDESSPVGVPGLPAPGSEARFLNRAYRSEAGVLNYKVYVPERFITGGTDGAPLVVMLHGCTQSPDDFAAGTQMNALAEQHGFLVVYPAQSLAANGSKCWNWFRAEDQQREGGEPSMIAGITREVAEQYRIDRRRIYVAGLSAGAAMAVILGVTYPELYAAVGAHSGLPYASAHDVASAFSAMRSGTAPVGAVVKFAPRASRAEAKHSVPTIVFHGDADHTVTPNNGAAIVETMAGVAGLQKLRVEMHDGATTSGRTYKRIVYVNSVDETFVEHWIVHGAGHAWSGGSSSGSFTDPAGPDASTEMVRFFYGQKRAGAS